MRPFSRILILTVSCLGVAQGDPSAFFSPIDEPDGWELHPFVEDRGDLQATLGQSVHWPLADPPVGVRRYSVSGLPPGLRMDEATGEITGRPKILGRFHVVLRNAECTKRVCRRYGEKKRQGD